MSSTLLEKINSTNDDLFYLLEETRRCLAGQGDFNVTLVRKLSAVISTMDSLVPRRNELRLSNPELGVPLDHYIRLATDLRGELEKIQIMLLARRSSIESARSQLHAASQFVEALSSTTR